jgi:hypothetical protein
MTSRILKMLERQETLIMELVDRVRAMESHLGSVGRSSAPSTSSSSPIELDKVTRPDSGLATPCPPPSIASTKKRRRRRKKKSLNGSVFLSNASVSKIIQSTSASCQSIPSVSIVSLPLEHPPSGFKIKPPRPPPPVKYAPAFSGPSRDLTAKLSDMQPNPDVEKKPLMSNVVRTDKKWGDIACLNGCKAKIKVHDELLYYVLSQVVGKVRDTSLISQIGGYCEAYKRDHDLSMLTAQEWFSIKTGCIAAAMEVPDEERNLYNYVADRKSIKTRHTQNKLYKGEATRIVRKWYWFMPRMLNVLESSRR